MAIRQSASGAIRGLGLCQSNAISTGGTMAIRESNPQQYNANSTGQATPIRELEQRQYSANPRGPIRWRAIRKLKPCQCHANWERKPRQYHDNSGVQIMPIPWQFASSNHANPMAIRQRNDDNLAVQLTAIPMAIRQGNHDYSWTRTMPIQCNFDRGNHGNSGVQPTAIQCQFGSANHGNTMPIGECKSCRYPANSTEKPWQLETKPHRNSHANSTEKRETMPIRQSASGAIRELESNANPMPIREHKPQQILCQFTVAERV